MKKQNPKVNNKLIIMLIILDLLLLSVFIYSFSDTKSDKQTGEDSNNTLFSTSPVFNSSLICYDQILSKKDNNQDWCERECRINNMTKIKYTSKGTDIICACKDSKGQIALKKVFNSQ